MEHLVFICPTTGRQVESGVESEIGTLLRIRNETLRVHCRACGQWHEWRVRDALLTKAA
jgi:transcription elongation factor Elf1